MIKWLSIVVLMLSGLVYGQSAFAAKCMLVTSYHQGYAWNDGVQRGVESVLSGKCDLKIFYMDTKRNKSKSHGEAMAAKAKKLIDEFQPDVLIAADDNASRYLVSKYYKNAELPVVFCAVNWNVTKYGYPYKNVTGMIEVAPIQPLIELARKVTDKLKTMVYLGVNTFTEKKNARRVVDVAQKQGVEVQVSLANDINEWKQLFVKAQTADFLILGSNAGIKGWSDNEMAEFVKRNAKKLLLSNHNWMAPFSMYTIAKVAEEQGEWAAEAALAIVKGLSPAKIPIRVNRKWQIYINTPLLKKAGFNDGHAYFKNAIEVGGRSKLD